jgi:transporter family-2 protein
MNDRAKQTELTSRKDQVMSSPLIQILVPVVVGAAIAVQSQLMARIDRGLGTLESILVTYGGGGLVIILIMLFRSGGNMSFSSGLPWYVFTTGLFGLVIVGGIGFSVARVGLVATFTVIVASQFMLSALIDNYGLLDSTVRSMSLSRVSGIGMLLAGVWMILK